MIKKRLINQEKTSMKHVLMIVFYQYIGIICNLTAIYLLGSLIQRVIDKNFDKTLILSYTLIFLLSFTIRYFVRIKTAGETFMASGRIKYSLRKKLYEKVVDLGANFEEKVSISKLVQLFSEGVEQIEIYFSRYLPQFFYSMTAPVILFLVVSFFSLKTGLALLVCVPLIPISIVIVQKFAKRLLKKYWGEYTKLGDDFYENINGLTTLKIYRADGRMHENMNQNAEHFRRITMKVLTMQLNSVTLMDLMAYMGAAVGLIFSLTELSRGKINPGQAFFIMMISSEFFIPLRLLGSYFHIAMNGMSASDSLFEILDLQTDNKDKIVINDFSNIKFKDICFSYNDKREILKDINFSIKKGQLIGLVGESGSGKSTIAGLLSGQFKNYRGRIEVGGEELKNISSSCLFKNICLIKNENYIFKGSVYDNLAMVNGLCDRDKMISLLKEVNLWSFLESKEGLETILEENANNLSGGQKQRLAIARALLLDSPIYIFDEATANIDVESEAIILELIEKLKTKKTILFISHRLVNVKNADEILVMDSGKIIERGRFKELNDNKGSFYSLYNKQCQLENFAKGGKKDEE